MSVNALIFTELMDNRRGVGRSIGAYRIANEIRKSGYTCQVVDFFTEFSEEEMEKIMSSFISSETLIVGFSSTFFMYTDERLDKFQKFQTGKDTQPPGNRMKTPHYPYHTDRMMAWFKKMKDINPNLKIVLGGSKTNEMKGLCDAYAIGYCDQAVVEYMKYLEGKNPFFQYDQLNDTQIMFFGEKNLGKFDFTDSIFEWHDTDHISNDEALPIEIARGCIFRCKFCSYPSNGKKKLDFIKKESILKDEFLKNYYEKGITRYVYLDDTHNDSIEKLEQLHRIVSSLPFELEYAAYLRHDLIYAHKETAILLRESGLRSAIFGIETLNHESGKAIGKGLHPDKTKELLYWLKNDIWKNEVATTSGFIVGLPHDTPETVTEWSQWLLEPDCPLDFFQFEPLYITKTTKKSRIWRSEFESSAEKYGYVLGENGNWYNSHFTFKSAQLMAQSFIDSGRKNDRWRCAGYPVIMASNLGISPASLIGSSRKKFVENMRELKLIESYIDQYKMKLLNQINYEIPI
jgi:hypothetical protein